MTVPAVWESPGIPSAGIVRLTLLNTSWPRAIVARAAFLAVSLGRFDQESKIEYPATFVVQGFARKLVHGALGPKARIRKLSTPPRAPSASRRPPPQVERKQFPSASVPAAVSNRWSVYTPSINAAT